MKRILAAAFLAVFVLSLCNPVSVSAATVHIVRPGQTLTSIARWYGVDYRTLARANGIVNPNRIYVGQRLLIPSTTGYVAQGTTYVVRAGDTLYGIARRSGVSAWAIAQANAIYNLQWIYVGQRLVIPGVRPVPVPRPSAPVVARSTGWRGEYYAGTSLSGTPCLVRYDSAINFHWGTGGPIACASGDHFSVRWARTFTFKGGVYRFYTRVDDGVRIWIDGGLVLDAWRVQPETDYAVDVTLTAGAHTVTVGYFEDAGIATIQCSFIRLGDAPFATPVPTSTPTSPAVWSAWYGEYFRGTDLSGAPTATRWDPSIGFEWGTGTPIGGVGADNFSVRWTRRSSFHTDNYVFCAMSDDGVRIYLDGQIVLNEWHPSNSVAYCGEADVTAGVHEMRAEYYEEGGNALIYVWWERR